MLRIGIVGLAQTGKTTLFRTVTRASADAPEGRTETRVGMARVPDERLDRLIAMYHPKKQVYASVEYLDTPGSVIDLARTGLQTQTLREADALAHVVRAFEEPPAPGGSANPQRDIESVELELILSDLAVVEKRLERLEKDIKKQKNPALEKEQQVLVRAKALLDGQTPLREMPLSADDERAIRGFTFLSLKPMLFVINVSERDAARTAAAEDFAREVGLKERPRTAVTAICGKVEAELAELDENEAAEFMASYGLKESAVARLLRSSFELLGLISFFTVGEDECRAWTLRSGRTALEAASEIHTDIQRGFIRAEVIGWEELLAASSLAEARSRATLRLEGKGYVVKDGEVVHFRHSG